MCEHEEARFRVQRQEWASSYSTLGCSIFVFIGNAKIPQTLQELLAPRNVDFFSREGKHLGNKRTLERQIHEITGISIHALRNQPLSEFDVSERLSWIKDRKTTRKEDRVYSLLGIFGIFLVPNYGEGEEYAMKRFKRELDEVEKDQLRQQVSCRGGEVAADITMNLEEGKQGTQHNYFFSYQIKPVYSLHLPVAANCLEMLMSN
jgi:hypothetical protein